MGLGVVLLASFALFVTVPRPALATVRAHATGVRDGCADAAITATSAAPQAMRDAVVCLVNFERARYRLPPLTQVHKLDISAQGYTAEMVRRRFFSHTAPDGSTPGGRIAATGYRWSWAGENIASGYSTPAAVVSGWMHSQGHCYNMLAPSFSNIGVGVSPHPAGGANVPSTWTQDFGLPRGAHAPSSKWGPANSCPH
ncbi:MAG TPA: CAP domain-containing protein [Solirubrobacteraceae bacterium]|nr:CAP domain-containing protein [Solirubrobacteraceae bacterium]